MEFVSLRGVNHYADVPLVVKPELDMSHVLGLFKITSCAEILRNVSSTDDHPACLKTVARGLTTRGGDGMNVDHFKFK